MDLDIQDNQGDILKCVSKMTVKFKNIQFVLHCILILSFSLTHTDFVGFFKETNIQINECCFQPAV